ncbi:carbamoyl transferase [Paenibacillus sp. 481]|uniref:carbamoyl transferase n=1 Tax=Paenibacillus sp. 481 TaxID=2835869 RepID=UPI001E54F487|nr:carbamoyl transferase [Paenibacillus sp. 481]UHA75260.1 carbamoyl transferase [Paenibacillus sp. 481]
MKLYVHEGWTWLKDHVYIGIILFLYQLLWGFFLYRFIEDIVVPVLHRYPNPPPTELSAQLFIMESQFHLMKTSEYTPYLWTALAFIVVHMLLTPLIHAGLFYSMAHSRVGLSFFKGIKTTWKSILFLYVLEMTVLLAPAYWFIPLAAKSLARHPSLQTLLTDLLPFALVWALGGWLLHHVFLFLKFGVASETALHRALGIGIRRLLPTLGLSALFMAIGLACSIAVTSAAFLWTGMTALILQQAFPAVRVFLKMWGLSARYAVWREADNTK